MTANGIGASAASDVRADALCSPFVTDLPVESASVSVFGTSGRQATVCNSDALAARADGLQFDLGEGPHWEALDSRAPVFCPDLSPRTGARWPVFADAARELGIAAVFAFPMMLGAALVGVVDLYSRERMTLGRDFVRTATSLAARAAAPAVDRALASADNHDSVESVKSPLLRREVHQATGVIVARLELSPSEAFAFLRARSFSAGIPLDQLARDIIERRFTFDELTNE